MTMRTEERLHMPRVMRVGPLGLYASPNLWIVKASSKGLFQRESQHGHYSDACCVLLTAHYLYDLLLRNTRVVPERIEHLLMSQLGEFEVSRAGRDNDPPSVYLNSNHVVAAVMPNPPFSTFELQGHNVSPLAIWPDSERRNRLELKTEVAK
ncbi:hypothetical protein [Rhodanobacter sp. MP1X3]|uniref:hypothetical protein n=1 Tax=Rhodanobacter sp. MP1X3 TaxID=2723086 RepID=UPI001815B1D0|nr:hypothetical protein [Rhodanobacter sp. MP1X3]MBB6241261.1 hypothetical protein [Rhodanobacter sp. MP1X3]